jgi:hypothetical protein
MVAVMFIIMTKRGDGCERMTGHDPKLANLGLQSN